MTCVIVVILLLANLEIASTVLFFKWHPGSAPFLWDINITSARYAKKFEIVNLLEIPPFDHETHINFNHIPAMFDIDPKFLSCDAVQKFIRMDVSKYFADLDIAQAELDVLLTQFEENCVTTTPALLYDYGIRRKFIYRYLFPPFVLARRRMAIFRNVSINEVGVIFDENNKIFIGNGGCNDVYSIPSKPVNLTHHDTVISIAATWGHTPYHFALEASTAFANVPDHLISTSLIHVGQINNFTINWLALLGIRRDQLICGSVHANTMFLPEMARCGGPSLIQLQWLRDKLLPPRETIKLTNIVLISRRAPRGLPNFPKVAHMLGELANENNLRLVLHDEESLPTMREQISTFANAAVVVAPHGAGELFMTFLPKDACVIEFNTLSGKNPVYARIAMTLNISYVMLRWSKVDMYLLKAWTNKCPYVRHLQGETGKSRYNSKKKAKKSMLSWSLSQ
jgi:hypothetical protein